jgi:hypothetical protein
MYGYKTAQITSGDKSVVVELKLSGDWDSRALAKKNSDDYNWLCGLAGVEMALSRALESDDGAGKSKSGLVSVQVTK